MRTGFEVPCKYCAGDGFKVRGCICYIWKELSRQNETEFWKCISKYRFKQDTAPSFAWRFTNTAFEQERIVSPTAGRTQAIL
jgi:hypothetical protein